MLKRRLPMVVISVVSFMLLSTTVFGEVAVKKPIVPSGPYKQHPNLSNTTMKAIGGKLAALCPNATLKVSPDIFGGKAACVVDAVCRGGWIVKEDGYQNNYDSCEFEGPAGFGVSCPSGGYELQILKGKDVCAKPVTVTANCPSGWHLKAGTASNYDSKTGLPAEFQCEPNKPSPIQCPSGYDYYDSGCKVGCVLHIE